MIDKIKVRGVEYDLSGEVDLTDYATKEYVDETVANNLSASGGGGSKLYRHTIRLSSGKEGDLLEIINDIPETFTTSALAMWLYNKGFNSKENCLTCHELIIDTYYTIRNGIFSSNGTTVYARSHEWTYSNTYEKLFSFNSSQNRSISVTSDTVTEL